MALHFFFGGGEVNAAKNELKIFSTQNFQVNMTFKEKAITCIIRDWAISIKFQINYL